MPWLPLSEAAARLGVNAATLKKRAQVAERRGEDSGRRAKGGRYEYWADDDRRSGGDRRARPEYWEEGEQTWQLSGEDASALRALGRLAELDQDAEPDHTATAEGEPVTEEEQRDPEVECILWVSDIHAPDHDRKAWAAFLDFAEEYDPDRVILGGDILELASGSQHGGALPVMLLADIEAGNKLLDELQEAVPDARIDFLEGNHETRLSRKALAQYPEIHGVLDLPSLLGLRRRGIRWYDSNTVLRVGHMAFVHGWWCNQHHASKHLREMNESIMYGHTHRAQVHIRGGPRGPQAAYGMPCMRDLQPDWLGGKPSGWSQGFGVVEIDQETGDYNAYQVIIHNGRFRWNGRTYGR